MLPGLWSLVTVSTAPKGPPYHFPKLIHQTVANKRNLSCEEITNINSWKDLNPGYKHILYDNQDLDKFMQVRVSI